MSNRLLIMPAHNESKNLPAVFAELSALNIPDLDVVVVDDYSTDDTAAVARSLGATVVSLPANLGYGGAVQTGFKYGVEHGYAVAGLMDSDGQHDAHYIPALLATIEEGEADLALGSRFLGSMEYHASAVRKLGQRFFAGLVSRLTHQRITDPTSGFQAMNADVMAYFARDNYPTDFPDADTILLLNYAGFRVREVPVTMRGRISGKSMHAGLKPLYYLVKMFLSIAIVLLRQSTHTNNMRPVRR